MKLKRTHYNNRLKAKMDLRAKENHVIGKYLYWTKGSSLFACAVTLQEVVLERSPQASAMYSTILEAWKLPGCQEIMPDFIAQGSKEAAFREKLLMLSFGGEVPSNWPDSWKATYEKSKVNNDWQILLNRVYQFILINFNRKIDIANGCQKIVPVQAYNLITAVFYRSIAEICQISIDQFNRYNNLKIDDTIYDLEHIMTTKPTQTAERDLKKRFIDTYKQYGFKAIHSSTLRKRAEHWYGSRVNPGTIEEYINELAGKEIYVDRALIEREIALCDEATGYPRKWRT